MDIGYIIRSVVLQLLFFCLIPLLWWCFKARKTVSFFPYVGLNLPKAEGRRAILALSAYCAIWIIAHLPAFTQYTQPSSLKFSGLGASAVLPAFLVSFLQQGLPEEILFRGFIGKRLCAALGFSLGNTLQAAIFAALHILLSSNASLTAGIITFATTFVGGFMLGYLSERTFGGSILVGAFLHGLGNFISNIARAFG